MQRSIIRRQGLFWPTVRRDTFYRGREIMVARAKGWLVTLHLQSGSRESTGKSGGGGEGMEVAGRATSVIDFLQQGPASYRFHNLLKQGHQLWTKHKTHEPVRDISHSKCF